MGMTTNLHQGKIGNMQYRKLNLIDGPDADLHLFMQLLKTALEFRDPAAPTLVDQEVMAKLIAMGVLTANVAGDGEGLQVWENITFWFDKATKYKNLRLQFMVKDDAAAQVAFMQWGAAQEGADGSSTATTVHDGDQLAAIIEYCGMPATIHTRKLG
jgi:hypothetical protein